MKDSLIYPGEHIPSPEVEGLQQKARDCGLNFKARPPINLRETDLDISIEVSLPGVKREDIYLYTRYHILYIIILGKKRSCLDDKEQIHEFDTGYLERRIILPEVADPDFMYAEYKGGILRLHIPKGKQEVVQLGLETIVY